MSTTRPITDLRDHAEEIGMFCREKREPVFITKDGIGEMVIVSIEEYEKQRAMMALYERLAESEAEAARGEGEDFFVFAEKLRERVHGATQGFDFTFGPKRYGRDCEQDRTLGGAAYALSLVEESRTV